MVFQVLKAQDPGTVSIGGDAMPGVLIVAITFPITAKSAENLTSFKCLRNPESEAAMDLLAGTKGRMQ
jgi:hypothetical protein